MEQPGPRRPGRPKTKPAPPALEKHGCVAAPENPDALVEFAYGAPLALKLLYTYCKSAKATAIHICFDRTGFSVYARDSQRRLTIAARLRGEDANWYYYAGESPLWAYVRVDALEVPFSSLNADVHKLALCITRVDPGVLMITTKSFNSGIDSSCYNIRLLTDVEPDPELYADDTTKYALEFSLTTGLFHRIVSNASRGQNNITFAKCGAAPLTISYDSSGVPCSETCNDANIALSAALEANEAVRAEVTFSDVKPLAVARVGEKVRIALGARTARLDSQAGHVTIRTLLNLV